MDSDNNDNNNSVYILSWRNWVLTGFPSNNLFEDFPNDELFLGRPEVVSDLNTNFLIWHGTSVTNSLTKNILNTQDTPPEGNSTAIFLVIL